VAVLYEGRQIYFGPKDHAKAYFTALGYHCPDRQTTADFLTSVTSPAERVVRPGFERKVPRTPDEFAEAWRRSNARAQLLREMDAFEDEFPLSSDQVNKLHVARNAQHSSLALVLRFPSPGPIPLADALLQEERVSLHGVGADPDRALRDERRAETSR
jgi:hypothetical protein